MNSRPSASTAMCRTRKTQKTYENSKLKWEEQGEGKHADLLAWAKALIKLRRSKVCLNDGDMHHLIVSTDEKADAGDGARGSSRLSTLANSHTPSRSWKARRWSSSRGMDSVLKITTLIFHR